MQAGWSRIWVLVRTGTLRSSEFTDIPFPTEQKFPKLAVPGALYSIEVQEQFFFSECCMQWGSLECDFKYKNI